MVESVRKSSREVIRIPVHWSLKVLEFKLQIQGLESTWKWRWSFRVLEKSWNMFSWVWKIFFWCNGWLL